MADGIAVPIQPGPEVRRLTALVLLVLLAAAVYLTVDVVGSWAFVLERRGSAVLAMIVVGWSIGLSTVVFQTVTENRILTPAIMGFDSLYILLQTALAFFFGATAIARMEPTLRFLLEAGSMAVFATLLYTWLIVGANRSVHLLVLVGVVFGVLFRSGSTLLQRLIDPGEFQVLQDSFFASFNRVDDAILPVAALIVGVVSLVAWRLMRTLDVLVLGRESAIGLGVAHRRVVVESLLVVAVLVAVSTALAGPTLFFGLLVAHLAYRLMGTHRHRVLVIATGLIAVLTLVGGQALLERVFHYDTALSIIVEFFGGILFIFLLLVGERR